MRNLRSTLANIAALVLAASGGGACSSGPSPKTISITPAVACSIATAGPLSEACNTACGGGGDMGASYDCSLPNPYAMSGEAGADAGCPAGTGNVTLSCGVVTLGRRTEGIEDVKLAASLDPGAYFSGCAYLEEVSVHAFDRLASELDAHGAPPALVAAALQARGEEERHAQLTRALALRFGGSLRAVHLPGFAPRSLLDIAIENAVEGCVRETYGAAVGLVGAEHAPAGPIRDALASIAKDECGHADLSWEIAEWILPLLGANERAIVGRALRRAVSDLRNTSEPVVMEDARAICGFPSERERLRIVALLDERVFCERHIS